jgi:MarR family transcriptional regulator, organic hydroperoxide resistance regulator
MIVRSLRRAGHLVSERLATDLEAFELTQGETHVLAGLAAMGGSATPGELHRAFGHRHSTVTGILDRLEQRGLVDRPVDPGDRRSRPVRLTAEGRKVAARVTRAIARLDRAIEARARPADVAGFQAVLAALEEEVS